MAFFDWLDDEEETPKKLPSYRLPGRGAERPTVTLPETGGDEQTVKAPSINAPDSGGMKPVKGQISEERSAQLQTRNAAESEVKNRGIQIVEQALKAFGLNPKEKLPAIYGATGNDAAGPVYNARLGGISQAARQAVAALETARLGSADLSKYESQLRVLEQLESDALRVAEKTPSEPYVPGAEKLADVQAKVLKAQEDLRYAVSPEQQKGLKATIDSGLKILESSRASEDVGPQIAPEELEARKADKERDVAKETDDLKSEAAKTQPIGGVDDILSVFRTLSADPKELAKQSLKYVQKLNEYLPIDPLSKVAFSVGISKYASILGQEATDRVLRPMALAHKMAEKAKAGFTQEAGKQEAKSRVGQEQLASLWKKKNEIFEELRSLEPLQSPLGIIAFILTSMIVGPSTAALIFVRSHRMGTLKAQINQIADEMKDVRRGIDRTDELANRARTQAAESEAAIMGRGIEQETSRQNQREAKALDTAADFMRLREEYRLREKMQAGKGEKDATGESILSMMGKKSSQIANLARRVNQWESLAEKSFDEKEKRKYHAAAVQAQMQLEAAEEQMEKMEEYYGRWHLRKYGTAPATADQAAQAETAEE